jgi:hypothetical protein
VSKILLTDLKLIAPADTYFRVGYVQIIISIAPTEESNN